MMNDEYQEKLILYFFTILIKKSRHFPIKKLDFYSVFIPK